MFRQWACAFVISSAVLPAYAAEWVPGPDTRIITFSGYKWFVKDSQGESVGPGPNLFESDNIWVEQGRLHLRIGRHGDRWTSAEIVSTESFGHGRYSFMIDSEIANLDPRIVLGLFTWSDDPAFVHREIDIEVSRWNNPENANAQCVVQPYDRPGAIIRFEVSASLKQPVYSFTWTPEAVTCAVADAGGFRFEHRFTDALPIPGDENARINLWQIGGQPPLGDQPQEVVISGFSFTPLSE
jgi:hypothetical protein